MTSCFMNANYQPNVQNYYQRKGGETLFLYSKFNGQSAFSESSDKGFELFWDEYHNAVNEQKRYSPIPQTSVNCKVQSYVQLRSSRSVPNCQIISSRSLSSPHRHDKSVLTPSNKWMTDHSLSLLEYCHVNTSMHENNENQSSMMKTISFQVNQVGGTWQKQNDYYSKLLTDSNMWRPPATGTYLNNTGDYWSQEARFGTRQLPQRQRRLPIHLQKNFTPNRSRRACMNLSTPKKAYGTNSTKSPKITKFLYDILVNCSLFKGVCDDVASDAISLTIKEMYTRDLKSGEVLVRQGDIGDAFFLVEYGELDVLVEQTTEGGRDGGIEIIKVAVIKARETVGETALMYNTKRSATLKAIKPTRVWVMEDNQFHNIRNLIKELTNKKVREQQNLLSAIPLFAGMKPYELSNLTQACQEVKFKSGETIISVNDSDDDMYIIKQGRVWAVPNRKNSSGSCHRRSVGEGEYFMRELLLKEDLRTLEASSDVQCVRIAKDDFDFLVSPYLNKYNKNHSNWFSERSNTDLGLDEELPKHFKNRVAFKLEDLSVIAHAGVGSFGRVKLVRVGKGTEKRIFALKVVEKNKVIVTNQIEHMKNERRAMFMMNSPFIVKLFATYQDSACVYFLLEKVLGGELFHLLRKCKSFNESMSRFYTGCVVLALEHVHSHGIIYRDLKPENLMITRNGYLKVIDFGFAKKRNQSTSLCGTPAYLAPEMITGGIQNFGVDWWCLGIFLYEMLVGQVPFLDSKSVKQYEDILTSSPRLPNYVTWESQELIHGLLEKNAFRRLGSSPEGAWDIKKQCWFHLKLREDKECFEWNKLEVCKLIAPYKPRVADDEDVRYLCPSNHYIPRSSNTFRDFDPSLYEWCEEF